MKLTSLVAIILLFTGGAFAQDFEIYNGDTINKKDETNKKQGKWIFFYDEAKTIKKKEGSFVNNKKEGIWTEYYKSGNKRNEITYAGNKKNGYAKIYYENGTLSEEGTWKGNKWVGDYKFYHKNGNKAYEWKYNEKGKRTGEQKYFYEDGSVMIEGEWIDGKENGVITEYYPDGAVKSKKSFNKGEIDVESIETFEKTEVVASNEEEIVKEVEKVAEKVAEKEEPKEKVPEDIESYLESLAKKYPEGVTKEEYEEGNKKILRVIVVRNGKANEYKKIKHPWGQVVYFKNRQSISATVFNTETKE